MAKALGPRPAADDPSGCDGTRTIVHEDMCNTPCPITTPEDNRRQLCDRSQEDAEIGQRLNMICLVAQGCACRCPEAGDANTEVLCRLVPSAPICSAPGCCYPASPAPRITDWHLHLGHSNLQPAFPGFRLLRFAHGGKPWQFQGWLNGAFKTAVLLKTSKTTNAIQSTRGSLYCGPASTWGRGTTILKHMKATGWIW